MKERIKEIRKAKGLTQQRFADELGVKRNTVAQWEIGTNAVTDQTIKSICNTYDISERWLRTGKGSMNATTSREEEFIGIFGEILKNNDSDVLAQIFVQLIKLDTDGLVVVRDLINWMANKKD